MPRIAIGRILSAAFDMYGKHWEILIALSASVYVVVAVGGTLAVSMFGTTPVLGILAGIVTAVFAILAGVVLQGMYVLAVDDLRDGRQDLTYSELFARSRPFLVPLLLTSILLALGMVAGFIMLIVPGFIFMTWWYVTGPAVVLEGKSLGAALGRSRELVRGEAWNVFGLLFVTGLIVACVNWVLGWTLSLMVSGETTVLFVKQLPGILTGPVAAMVPVLPYFDLRGDTRTGETPIPTAA
jgi:hypothetical protein